MVSMGLGTIDWPSFDSIFREMQVSISSLLKIKLETIRNMSPRILWKSLFRAGLKRNGIVVVKENITSSGEVEIDDQDSSVTRTDGRFHYTFDAANLEVIRELPQKKLPQELYNVKMYAMRPKVNVWKC